MFKVATFSLVTHFDSFPTKCVMNGMVYKWEADTTNYLILEILDDEKRINDSLLFDSC
jgi:hypothetical protein